MKSSRGLTLIELMIVVSLVGLLAAVVIPYLGAVVKNARARNVVSKFTQDFAALRNVAATGTHAVNAVNLTLATNCTWAASVDGNADATHSMTAAALSAAVSGLSCAGQNGTVLPVQFVFTNQGFVAPSAAVTFSLGGQNWPLLVLSSGTIANTTGGN